VTQQIDRVDRGVDPGDDEVTPEDATVVMPHLVPDLLSLLAPHSAMLTTPEALAVLPDADHRSFHADSDNRAVDPNAPGRAFSGDADERTLVIEPDDRTLVIEPDDRTMVIPRALPIPEIDHELVVEDAVVDEAAAGPAPPPSADPQAIGRQVGVGAMWSAANAATLRLATFVVSLLVAHLVAPYYFGVFTVALTVYGIAMSISELGVSSAIVREHDRSPIMAPTVFTISLINGALLALLLIVSAPYLASELGASNAATAIRILSGVLFLSGFSAVPAALMSRDFMQRQRFITDAGFFVVSTVTLLLLLWLLSNPVMALALSLLAAHLTTVILIVWMSPEKYWPGLVWPEAKHLLTFGLPLAGSNLLTVAIANIDFIVVGHTLGAQKLGYYSLAFNISSWPVTIFSSVLISVTLPTLSRVRDSPTELTRHMQAGLSAVVAASFPVCALFAGLAGPLIDTVYGTRWHPAWTALIVLSLFGAARTVLQLFSDLAIAVGLTRRLLVIQLAWIVVLAPVMIFCVHQWGIEGAGIAHASVVILLVIPFYLHTVRRNTTVHLSALPSSLIIPFIASVAAGIAAYESSRLPDGHVVKLLVGVVCGLLVYLVIAGRWMAELAQRLRAMYWTDPGRRPRRRRYLAPSEARHRRR
jgi:PST family polysaccharide transporter